MLYFLYNRYNAIAAQAGSDTFGQRKVAIVQAKGCIFAFLNKNFAKFLRNTEINLVIY